MSATILSGAFTVYFTNDTGGDKQIRYTGGGTTYTINALYSALQDLFDNNTAGVGDYMDEGIPMKGVTPTEYLIGRIETNDSEPWYIDNESIKYLTGGALSTTGWTRVTGTSTGIVQVPYTLGTDFSASDIGKTVVSSDGDSGKLLDYDGNYAYVRPDSNAAANDFNSGTMTVTAGSAASVTILGVNTGEYIWANIYTLGSIQPYVRLYVEQGGNIIPNWWGDGHFDILVKASEGGAPIALGLVTVYARQGTKLYDHFTIDIGTGGRNAIPLSTAKDTNNPNGYKTVSVASAGGVFTVGELVTGGTNGGEGVVTLNTGSPTTAIEYYLVGDLTDFTNGETLTGSIVGANGTAGTPANAGAANYSDVTVTFGWDNTFDIDGDGTNENYSIVVDCNSRPLSEVYERLKYLTRRGNLIFIDGIYEGQQYIGIDYRVPYISMTGTVSAGDFVSQLQYPAPISSRYGMVVAVDTTNKYVMISDTRGGKWQTGPLVNNIEVDGSNYLVIDGTTFFTEESISPIKVSPFGTLAGGRFFGARGVVLDNVAAADINNYEVIDDNGDTYSEPIQVATVITVVDATTQLPIENARVIIAASDGTGDLPYQVSVTITRSGTTATVAHTAHPYKIGDKVNIVGDATTDNEYTGAKTITAVATNSYDYTVAGTPATPATGTITSTGLILEGLTDVNGKIFNTRSLTVDQPIVGRARKSTSSPLYKTGPFAGVIDSVDGYTQTVSLILDESR